MRNHFAVIHKSPGGSTGISFPDFPGCVSCGDSTAEAIARGMEALELHIEGMLAEGMVGDNPHAQHHRADHERHRLTEARRGRQGDCGRHHDHQPH